MSQKCKVCALGNKKVKELEEQYLNGSPMTKLAQKYGVGYDSVVYHLEHHLSHKLVRGMEMKQAEDGFDLLNRIDQVLSRTEEIFQRNFNRKRDRLALEALNSQRNTLELLAKISVELHKAKAAELEATREANQFGALTQPQGTSQQYLQCLTKAERDVLFKLQMKILGQTEEIIIEDEPGPKSKNKADEKPLKRKRSLIPKGGDKPENEQEIGRKTKNKPQGDGYIHYSEYNTPSRRL